MINFTNKKIAKRRPIGHLLAGIISVFALWDVSAAILLEQSPINGADAFLSNLSAGAQNADDFLLTEPAKIERISFWGSYDGIDSDDFVIRILSNDNGSPSAVGAFVQAYSLVAVSATLTALDDSAGSDVYQYDFDLPTPVSLMSGTYFLSVSNETQVAGWYWLLSQTGGNSWSRAADGDAWTLNSSGPVDIAFRLEGQTSVVPLPGAMVLFSPSIFAIVLLGRRKCG